ncbi:MAG: hypothetical protein IJO87_09380 [Eggerthellaceae bacterium]|nr:hypothetical protein [Eggerthellaceae bacterium]
MSEDKLKDAVAREMLTVMTLPGVPPTVLLDCDLKRKYHSEKRPWPYRDAVEALTCFQKIAAEGQKKYAGIAISIEKDVILRLEKRG